MKREEKYQGISIDDVWGKCTDPMSDVPLKRLTNGMLIARGLPYNEGSPEAKEIQDNSDDKPLPQRCPVLNDLLPYKSVSVICEKKDLDAVIHWLTYVHGGDCISHQKETKDGKIFLRSNYMCW